MFDKLNSFWGQFKLMQRFMGDENFKSFISHPKVQELLKDPEFKKVAQTKDFSKLMSHPKFSALLQDPELRQMLSKINPTELAP